MSTDPKEIMNKLWSLTKEYRVTLDPQKTDIIEIVDPLLRMVQPTDTNDVSTLRDRIYDFYKILDDSFCSSSEKTGIKNIDVIKKDSSIPTLNFLMSITFIAVTLATGILPVFLVVALLNEVTGKDIAGYVSFNLFQSRGQNFAENIKKISSLAGDYSRFFAQNNDPLSRVGLKQLVYDDFIENEPTNPSPTPGKN